MAAFFNVCARFFRLKSVGTDGFRFLFIYLHNIGFGSTDICTGRRNGFDVF